jgi:hypothetical protein
VSFTFTMEETEEGGCCKGDLDRLPHEVVLPSVGRPGGEEVLSPPPVYGE